MFAIYAYRDVRCAQALPMVSPHTVNTHTMCYVFFGWGTGTLIYNAYIRDPRIQIHTHLHKQMIFSLRLVPFHLWFFHYYFKYKSLQSTTSPTITGVIIKTAPHEWWDRHASECARARMPEQANVSQSDAMQIPLGWFFPPLRRYGNAWCCCCFWCLLLFISHASASCTENFLFRPLSERARHEGTVQRTTTAYQRNSHWESERERAKSRLAAKSKTIIR